MNHNENVNELDNIARQWAAHFARLGIRHIDEAGLSREDNGLAYTAASGRRIRVWAWSYTDMDSTEGVAVRILDDADDSAPVGEAWATIR